MSLTACGGAAPKPEGPLLLIADTTEDITVICGGPCPEACRFQLEAVPSDASLLEVLIEGVPVASSSDGGSNWLYSAPSAASPIPFVNFVGSLCNEVSNSTAAHPLHIEFRIVETS